MQNNKKSKKRSIDDLHDILDEASYKESPSENKKYLKALDRRLKRSSYDFRVFSKLVAMQVGEEEVSLEPKVSIYLRGGGKRTEFPEVKKEDIIIKVEAVPTILEEKPEKKPFEDEDIIEIEKVEYKDPQFIEVKPKVIVKEEEIQEIEKKAIGEEDLTEWEEIDQKDEEKPEWESLEEGVFITTDERPPKKPPQELPKQEEKFEIVSGFCGQCGAKLVTDDKFCPNCGINIEADIEKEMIEEEQHEPVQKIKPETTFIPIEKVEEEEPPEWEPATTRIKIIEEEPKEEKEFKDKYNKIEVFKDIKSINDDSAVLLFDKGFTSVESLKDVALNVLVDMVGIPKKLAKKIKKELDKKFKESTLFKPVVLDAPAKDKDIDEMIKEEVLSKAIEEPAPVELQTKTSEWEPIEDIEKEEFEEQKFVKDPELDVFKDIKSIDKKTALVLYNNGFTSIYSISMASIKDLAKIKGIKRKIAKEIKTEIDQKVKPLDIPVKKSVKVSKEEVVTDYFEEVEPGFMDIDAKIQEQEEEESLKLKGNGFFKDKFEEMPSTDKDELDTIFKDIPIIDKKIAKLLIENGIDSVEVLKNKTIKDLTKIRGIKKKIAKQIKKEAEKYKKVTEESFETTTFESVDEHMFDETSEEWESFDEKKISETEKKEIVGFMHGDYTLYKKVIETKDGKKRTVRFFSIAQPEDGEPIELPKGYEVKENKKTGLPFLKKKK